MNRRGFFSRAMGGLAALAGAKATEPVKPDMVSGRVDTELSAINGKSGGIVSTHTAHDGTVTTVCDVGPENECVTYFSGTSCDGESVWRVVDIYAKNGRSFVVTERKPVSFPPCPPRSA